jgi:fluoride exporter
MLVYVLVSLGSAIGGCLRYALTRAMLGISPGTTRSTILINVLGSFCMGYIGNLTISGSRFQASESMRIFLMVGICGGFTTFSSFSLQNFYLLRSGAWGRALVNAAASVLLCLGAVALGYLLAHRTSHSVAIVQTSTEETAG